eukprot:gene29957-36180_t
MGGVIGFRSSTNKYTDVMDTFNNPVEAPNNVEDAEEDVESDGGSSESSVEDKVPADVAWKNMFQDKTSKQLQELAIKFVSENIYYAVPVRSNTRMNGYKPIIWIEPLPHLIEEALAGKGSLDKDIVDGLPTGVLINSKGAITIYFSLIGIEYKISRHYVQLLDKSFQFTIEAPLPPKLKGATQNSLTISWYKELPLPVGVVQTVEVHYTAVDSELDDKLKWQVLVTKQYQKSLFYEFTYSSLLPGHMYRFRLRFLSPRGWSDFSAASSAYSTLPDRPDPPAAPVYTAITCYAVELAWCAPSNCNGSTVIEYILVGKSVGDEFTELYRGANTTYLALGLFPQYAYSFKLAAVNSCGVSEFSSLVSLVTPAAPCRRIVEKREVRANEAAALRYFSERQVDQAIHCRDAWCEFWDPRTEQAFYFNSIIAIRQLEVPEVLLRSRVASDSTNSNITAATNGRTNNGATANEHSNLELDRGFRVKRYKFLRALHRRKKQLLKSFADSTADDESRMPTSALLQQSNMSASPSRGPVKDSVNVILKRESILLDGYRAIVKLNNVDVMKKFKFAFQGEAGIDSGGVGKEAFLLMSKLAAQFAIRRKYMRYTKPLDQQVKEADKDKKDLFSQGLFFASAAKDDDQAQDTELSHLSVEQLAGFMGKLLGKAVLDRQLVDFPLSSLLLKHMVGCFEKIRPDTISSDNAKEVVNKLLVDLKDLDGEYCSSMEYLLNSNIQDVLPDQNFVVETFYRSIPLCANGESIIVDEDNKFQYVCLLILWKIHYSVSGALSSFLEAFHNIVPLSIIREGNISANELGLILIGKQIVDVEELRAYCLYQDDEFSEFHESAVWFWRAVREFDDTLRRKLLQFFTGSTRVPLDGYEPPLALTLALFPVCWSFLWQPALPGLGIGIRNRKVLAYGADSDESSRTTRQIEAMMNQAVALSSKISLNTSKDDMGSSVMILKPAKLSFSSSYMQKIIFNDTAKAVKYLELPVSNYSMLDSQMVSKTVDADSGDTVFYLQLPLGDFTSAVEMISRASLFVSSRPKRLFGLTTIRVSSQPKEGYIRMKSGPVYLKTVPVNVASNDDVEDFSEIFSKNYTNLTSFESQGQPDSKNVGNTKIEENVSSSGLPVWLVWSNPEDTSSDKRMSVQPAIDILLKWSPPFEKISDASSSFSLPNIFAQRGDLDQLVVSAKVVVKVESNVPIQPALAAGLSFLPIKLLIQQAGSLILSVIVKTMAPRFIDLLLKDYYNREL